MKLSFSLYLLGCLQLIAYNGYSQNKVTLDLEETPLESIIKDIELQTNYSFIYNNDEIDTSQKLDIEVSNIEVDKVLNKLFTSSKIQYVIKNKHIILSIGNPKKSLEQKRKFTLSGIVQDAVTGETLLGADILVKGKAIGTVTNEYGFYSITLPEGNYVFQVLYLGFETKEFEINLIKNQKLNIELKPSSNELEEVVITSGLQTKSQVNTILTGVSHLKSEDIKKIPAFFGEPDITRAILTQPGISSVGEGASGFNVRGGNIDQNLILLDEAPLYNSSHLWGLFSVFNADAIKDLKLYKGGIPARFGGRGSSVLDIRQKEGNTKEFKGEGGLGLLFSRITLEGPIKKEKLNFLVSGRRSYFDLFFPLGNEDIKNNKIYFYDLNTKISWNINENNKLYVSGYFGADVMKLNFKNEAEGDENPEPDQNIDFRWNNATASLRWNHIFSNRLFMNITGVYSRYNYALTSENDTGGGPADSSGSFKWQSDVKNWIIKPDITFYVNPTTKLRFGLNSTLYQFSPAKISSDEEGINNLDFKTENGLEIAPYFEIEKKWKKLSMNAGLRYSWFANVGEHDVFQYNPDFPLTTSTVTGKKHYDQGEIIKSYSGFEPRLSLKYNLDDRKAFKIGYNRMFQYIHLISNTSAALPFDVWKPSGTYIKPLEVNQFSIGYAFDTQDTNYNFSLEGYYKSFKNIVEYKNGANLFVNEQIETELLSAKGYSYGAEFSLHKNKGRLTGNVNYTYSVTRRKTTSEFSTENINNGEYYPSNYDRPHIFNLTMNFKLGKKWDMGTFFTYQTGRPTTQPTGRLIFDGDPYLTYSSRNAYRIPDTHRMDVSVTYTPTGNPKTKWQGSWNFGVYNVYGNENAFSVYSTFNNNTVKTYQFSLIGKPIPFVTYNFKF